LKKGVTSGATECNNIDLKISGNLILLLRSTGFLSGINHLNFRNKGSIKWISVKRNDHAIARSTQYQQVIDKRIHSWAQGREDRLEKLDER
jgi:hypothetical protein